MPKVIKKQKKIVDLMTNYTITPNFDITNLRLSDGAYRCYMLLQHLAYANKTEVYLSIKYIAVSLERSYRSVNRYMKESFSIFRVHI
ncbi:hypothetical protein NPD5_155 [Clostridium sporogenes]|uniref:Helix-turn-helix domain-containing protein n=1 Tax=Clostridium sporogenes TaxID=1509 RepID=A0A1L3NB10_CLOSG|nr:hypothetical protein [Clostridium sporogenes]APH13307.1 hypothetical protein NPD5_155 [Clostridium sporogenes]